MNDFLAPLQDMRFAMLEIAGLRGLSGLKGFGSTDCETATQLLAGGARFYQEVWAPSKPRWGRLASASARTRQRAPMHSSASRDARTGTIRPALSSITPTCAAT
jgi:hypothetical protein